MPENLFQGMLDTRGPSPQVSNNIDRCHASVLSSRSNMPLRTHCIEFQTQGSQRAADARRKYLCGGLMLLRFGSFWADIGKILEVYGDPAGQTPGSYVETIPRSVGLV